MTPYPEKPFFPLITLEETQSTNSYLRELCLKPTEEFTTVATSFQTAGRGQRGNSWESEAGQNLLFSFVLHPHFLEVRQQFLLSQIVSLSIKEVLETFTNEISIKWPNDIYWRNKKIAGILIENDLTGSHLEQSIIGVGININQQEFHSLAPNPVSLRQITGKEYVLPHILRLIIERMQAYYSILRNKDFPLITTYYQNALFRKRGFHPYRDSEGEFEAEIVRITPEGVLVLRDKTGKEKEFLFKEIEYILNLTKS